MNYAYIRVSTVEQNEARQLEAMKKYDIPAENFYIEKISGKDTNRPELQKLLNVVQKGDTIHIHDFSRLSRSTSDLLNVVNKLNERGVHLVSNKENFDTSTATGRLMLTMIAAINAFERENMIERVREGCAIAKANGKYKQCNVEKEDFVNLYLDVKTGKLTVKAAAEMLNISRVTWYAKIKEYELEN